MATTTNLELLLLTETMSQKALAVNTATEALEEALSETYTLDTTDADSAGHDLTLPYDDANDLSDRTALRFVLLIIDDQATAAFNVIHPDNKHLFIARNDSSHTATVKTASGTGIDVPAGATRLLYCDGTNVIDALPVASSTVPYDFDVAVYGSPEDGQVISRFVVGREVTFPADFSGSQGSVITNPTATNTFDVDDDGTKIGEISVATNGTVTFTTTGNTAQTVAAGSILTVHNQATADATLAGLAVVLLGEVDAL